jgi:hypothetical protein
MVKPGDRNVVPSSQVDSTLAMLHVVPPEPENGGLMAETPIKSVCLLGIKFAHGASHAKYCITWA